MRTLRAVGGLCNRLQAILSARAKVGPLRVVWSLDEAALAGARFSDLFDPLDGVEFVEWAEGVEVETYAVCDCAPDGWERGYLDLKPKQAIVDRVANLNAGTYAAMHIRRSAGFVELAEKLGGATPLYDFYHWTGEEPVRSLPLYIATDNAETQRAFLKLDVTYCNHVIETGIERQGLGNHEIHTSVSDAVVDLYVCAGAAHFMGSRHSSFTDTIERLRALR